MRKYKVVQPDIIDPDDLLGAQEPMDIDNEIRDLVNVEDDNDRFMASPDDFPTVGEIINEDDFYLKKCAYVDGQGVGNANFAFRKEQFDENHYSSVYFGVDNDQ